MLLHNKFIVDKREIFCSLFLTLTLTKIDRSVSFRGVAQNIIVKNLKALFETSKTQSVICNV